MTAGFCGIMLFKNGTEQFGDLRSFQKFRIIRKISAHAVQLFSDSRNIGVNQTSQISSVESGRNDFKQKRLSNLMNTAPKSRIVNPYSGGQLEIFRRAAEEYKTCLRSLWIEKSSRHPWYKKILPHQRHYGWLPDWRNTPW